MKTHTEIYKEIYRDEYSYQLTMGKTNDKCRRLANIKAVKLTSSEWKEQFKELIYLTVDYFEVEFGNIKIMEYDYDLKVMSVIFRDSSDKYIYNDVHINTWNDCLDNVDTIDSWFHENIKMLFTFERIQHCEPIKPIVKDNL